MEDILTKKEALKLCFDKWKAYFLQINSSKGEDPKKIEKLLHISFKELIEKPFNE